MSLKSVYDNLFAKMLKEKFLSGCPDGGTQVRRIFEEFVKLNISQPPKSVMWVPEKDRRFQETRKLKRTERECRAGSRRRAEKAEQYRNTEGYYVFSWTYLLLTLFPDGTSHLCAHLTPDVQYFASESLMLQYMKDNINMCRPDFCTF